MAHRRVPVSGSRPLRRVPGRRCHRAAVTLELLAAVTVLMACAPAEARAAKSGPDRLRITSKQDHASPSSEAVVVVTGTVGRSANTAPIDVYTGVVSVMALPRPRRCPRNAPRYMPYSDAITVQQPRFSWELAIHDAFLVGRKLRLCGYLAATRGTASGPRTITVARDSTPVTVAVPDGSPGDTDVGVILGGIMAWIFVIGLIAAVMRVGSWLLDDTPSAPATRRKARSTPPRSSSPSPHPAVSLPSPAVPTASGPSASVAAMHRATAQAHADHPLRRAKPRDVIQDAVDAIADTYRDRLQTILEQQDGPGWIDALNHRRHVSMTLGGRRAPRPYEFLEPRAVLNCLAYDPVGLQLISAPAATKARQLLGLVNEARHPRPDAPLTEADGYRAWRLYTDITGHVPAGDPFER
jgi:hypothetical protein